MRMYKIVTKYCDNGKQWNSSPVWVAGQDEASAIQNLLRLRKLEDRNFEAISGLKIVDTDYLFCTEAYDTEYNI